MLEARVVQLQEEREQQLRDVRAAVDDVADGIDEKSSGPRRLLIS